MTIEQKVIEVLSDKLSVDADRIKPDILLVDDLGLDSLSTVEMLFDLEAEYGIDIPDEDVQAFRRPRDIVAYLENRIRN